MSARILIIEDDEATLLKFLRRGLAYEGYQVDTAADGQSGLALARDNPPDLAVLDLMLPGIDGLEVCRRLRAGGPVPILILTAKDTVNDRIQIVGELLQAQVVVGWSARGTEPWKIPHNQAVALR